MREAREAELVWATSDVDAAWASRVASAKLMEIERVVLVRE